MSGATPQQQLLQDGGLSNIQELQDTVSRLSSHNGIESVLILNRAGDILAESTKGASVASSSSDGGNRQGGGGGGDPSSSSSVASDVSGNPTTPASASAAKFTKKLMETATAYLKTLSEDEEISFVQIRSKQHREIMIAPHNGFVLAVLKC